MKAKPPAIQAALENGRIHGFVLSPPEAGIAEARGYGHRLVEPSVDFPDLRGLPFLVLVAKTDADEATVLAAARAEANVAAHLEGRALKKVLYVPGRILTLVV